MCRLEAVSARCLTDVSSHSDFQVQLMLGDSEPVSKLAQTKEVMKHVNVKNILMFRICITIYFLKIKLLCVDLVLTGHFIKSKTN